MFGSDTTNSYLHEQKHLDAIKERDSATVSKNLNYYTSKGPTGRHLSTLKPLKSGEKSEKHSK